MRSGAVMLRTLAGRQNPRHSLRIDGLSCFRISSRYDRIYSTTVLKCQLDATDDFYCRSYCLLNMFRAPLCPSSGAREYYTGGCCLWYLVLWFSSCRYGVELRVMSGLRAAATCKPKHQIPQAATTHIILSSS